ncbi:ribonuclease HII [Candidatus Micrarchaeota archaeon]|nr:ribonuclease HII [Candidatus Micrarchaeota archaeon]
MLIAGIDEAGKGCVFGPLVIGIAIVDEVRARVLADIGVRDSKVLSHKSREEKSGKLRKALDGFVLLKITAKDLSEQMRRKISLNDIEAKKIGEALHAVKAGVVYVDAVDVDEKRYEERIRKHYAGKARLVCEHKADVKYPIVSAASILAKVERDDELHKIKKELGEDFGSGYSSDERTIEFLRKNLDNEKVLKYVRTEWATLDRLKQRKLGDF